MSKQIFHNGCECSWLGEVQFRDKRVLDVGAGTGRLLRYVESREDQPAAFVGVDLAEEMLHVARERTGHHSHAWFLQCDAEFLPFVGEGFDLVTCFGLFEYVANLQSFLQEFSRVTAPKGLLLFTCRNLERLLPFPNRFYPVVDHARGAVQDAVQECGYRLVRHETIYHLNGRWIWGLTKVSRPVGWDSAVLHSVMALNRALQASWLFGHRGKTHIVLAQRP
jgi:SAM-dependent methyltransferase